MLTSLFWFNGTAAERVAANGVEDIRVEEAGRSATTQEPETVSSDVPVMKPAALRASVGLEGLSTLDAPVPGLLTAQPAFRAGSSLVLPDARTWDVLPRELRPYVDDETLWLARGIYSETKRPAEQELVAWTIRNRVETQYRGKKTYRDVVLDPYQFSAFNPGTRKRSYYSSLSVHSAAKGWQKALRVAYEVKHMPGTYRPFPVTTRHFYSERSMRGRRHPHWARGQRPVQPVRDYALDARRFRFFSDIT